jgi:hypothetical protein
MGRKLNCWEYTKCGRGPRGHKVKELGPCPVASCESADGLHGGIKGGRMCWAIVGTYSIGEECTAFAKTNDHCYNCTFHRMVLKEEGLIKGEPLRPRGRNLPAGAKKRAAKEGGKKKR